MAGEARPAAAREETAELRSQIEELTRRLADWETVLSRLEITRETMTEILSGDGAVRASVDEAAGEAPVSVDGSRAGSPVGVRLVPQWEPGLEADVLPRSYRDVVEVMQDAVHPMWTHHLCAALGLSTDKNKVEGFRSKLKRLVERGWLAEHAGHVRPGPMQRLLRSARWDAGAVRDEVRRYVVDHLGTDDGVLIVDETGFLKKGRDSAGVQRQYTGTAGRIENSQVGVFLAYASSRGRALIDRRLYLPEHTWCQDAERRRKAGVPEDVVFSTKPRLALQMIAAALDAGVSTSWVTGDEAYGQDPGLRAGLEAREVGYVLAVSCATRARINQGRTLVRADEVASRLPVSAWNRQSAGPGAKGPRYYD
ncbi:IS701 family transposase [Streptomyces sp. NPDC046197]|uniref:IS701 family transposase n=1 Tax=Streptomyces sp. NPDC046197 TaxID=3154337 RepID=UPI0033EF3BE6